MTEPTHKGLRVSREVADAAAIPEDLDADLIDPDYWIPNTHRRRRAGVVWIAGAVLTAGIVAGAGLPLLMYAMAAFMVLIGAYHLAAGWNVTFSEDRALELANREVDFAVGHASAVMNFEGWLAKPVWNVLVFSADDPPTERGLIRVDALSGAVVDHYVEAIPGDH